MDPKDCAGLIEEISQAQSIEEVHTFCERVCFEFGFDHFIYGSRIPTSFVKPQIIVVSGYPTPWWERYKEEGYMPEDPLLAYCAGNTLPVDWQSVIRQNAGKRGGLIMDEARDFGLRSGLAFPIHSASGEFGLISFASEREHAKNQADIQRGLPLGQFFTSHVHEAVRRIIEIKEISAPSSSLTPREKECLLWAAEGKTSWETAQILNISERTVIFHIQNICAKLNVSNRQQAIARAIAMGLITPQFN